MKLPDRSRHPLIRGMLLTLILIAVNLIVALPFKVLEVIPGFTDIRPVTILQPIYGIFFGLPGCFACAISNLIGDAMSDSLRWSSIGGFFANFLGLLIFWLFATRVMKNGYDLRTAKHLLGHSLVVVIAAGVEIGVIAPMVAAFYPDVDIVVFSLTVLANNTVYPLLVGIPIIILMQEELGFRPQTRRKKEA